MSKNRAETPEEHRAEIQAEVAESAKGWRVAPARIGTAVHVGLRYQCIEGVRSVAAIITNVHDDGNVSLTIFDPAFKTEIDGVTATRLHARDSSFGFPNLDDVEYSEELAEGKWSWPGRI